MTQAEALRQLDELPYHWTIGKGRVSTHEPLWAVEVFRVTEAGLCDDVAPVMTIEGDSLEYCVTRIVARHLAQGRKDR
jgi:hypothetical protein